MERQEMSTEDERKSVQRELDCERDFLKRQSLMKRLWHLTRVETAGEGSSDLGTKESRKKSSQLVAAHSL